MQLRPGQPRKELSGMDDKGEPGNDEAPKAIKPTSKEFRKTWGFRRTTIAKREGAGDAEADSEPAQPPPQSLSLRRSGRQPKRTERVEEFLTTVRRRGRRSAAVSLEDSGELTSCAVTDAETASEGSVESASEVKSGPRSGGATGGKERPASSAKAKGSDEDDDTSDSDSDGLTLKELQNRLRRKREQEPASGPLQGVQHRLRKRRREGGPAESVGIEAGGAAEGPVPGRPEPEHSQGAASPAARGDKESAPERRAAQGLTEEESGEPVRHKPECEVYDPSTLYCLCRQPHNNRFMICCDRCEEWFHGDCVGISEARGRLLERNGEDYICPNCTILQVQDEADSETADGQEARYGRGDAAGADLTSIGTVEQKSSEDQGIKGRIEKAANPSGKKKLKIFQPVTEALDPSKCTGPGCSNAAQPGTVYCSNDCILKHAEVAIKFLNSGQEPKVKEKPKVKPEKLNLPKCSAQAGIRVSSVHKRPAADRKENAGKKAVGPPCRSEALVTEAAPESSTPSWASDHNYNAVQPEQTAASSAPLLCKSVKDKRTRENVAATVAMPKKMAPAGPRVSRQPSSLPRNLVPKKSPAVTPVPETKQAVKTLPSGFKGTIPKRPWLSPPTSSASAAKQPGLAPTAVASTSKMSPSSSAIGPSVGAGTVRKPGAGTASTSSAVPERLTAAGVAPSQPNSQIRQNIRRSLKEILWKRVSDSDDLTMTENEVGRVAFHIEKEMFNLFHVTDSRYKSKYRSIMFNLKDPKNQGLFHRVLREEISLAKLVRMKPEELVSKELSMWKERPAKSVMEARSKLHSESKKSAVKQEAIPDMEDSPPVSDSDEQQESVRVVPEKSSAPLLDVVSSMLKDTTSQHRAHLFDLNCRVCTGQVSLSDDEPALKKPKPLASAKREDARPRYDSVLFEAAPQADGGMPGTPPEGPVEAELERTPCPDAEKSLLPVHAGPSHLEPSPLQDLATFPASCAGPVLTTVTVSGRDPRTAPGGMVTAPASVATRPAGTLLLEGAHTSETKQDTLKPAVTSVVVPKSILAKPSSSPEPSVSESRSPPEGDTTLFLSRLGTIWKGFINMQNVAKFVTKAYPVSGRLDCLSEDLPDTIHIGGRISPRTVWDYVGKLKSSVSKELCLIRFHPATEEEEVAYISLYSYFSSRGRFGVVANNSRHVKDLYLIPLSARDPVPPKLLPFEGPGLEAPRPNIILGLVICQKVKRPFSASEPDKVEEKRSRLQTQEDADALVYPRGTAAPQADKRASKYPPYPTDSTAGTPPPPSPPPPPPPPPEPPIAPASSSVLKILSLPTGTPATAASATSPAVTAAASTTTTAASKTATPLEHILQTLFGKKKSFDPLAKDSAEPPAAPLQHPRGTVDGGVPAAPLLDPIVQQFGQFSKEKALDEEEGDRPYDPEEEYDPERAFGAPLPERGRSRGAEVAAEPAEREEVAYDPEDETILEEAKVAIDDLPNRMCADCASGSSTPSLVEQQKMLEELNKQIEEQTRQLEEQEAALRQQRATVGASMAHFSVSDALMSPPPKSALTRAELFRPEQQTPDRPALLPAPNQAIQSVGQSTEARPSRDPRQARRLATESGESEVLSRPPANPSCSTQSPGDTLGDKVLPMLGHDSQQSAPPENAARPLVEGTWPPAAADTMARPSRRVLLPTPPGPAFQPGPPLQNLSPPGGRDPLLGTAFASQEKPLRSSQGEDPRIPQFAEKNESPAAEPEGEREPLPTASEGTTVFPPPMQKAGGPLPQFQGQREAAPRTFGMSGLPGPSFPGPRGPVLPFPEEGVSNDGPRGPLPARVGAQKGPIPSLFSGQQGPPPHGDTRGHSPSYLAGPRGVAPAQLEERRDPHGEKRELRDTAHADTAGPSAPCGSPEQTPLVGPRGTAPFPFGGQRRPLLPQFKGPRGGPPPSQFGGQRGPSPGHFGGPRGPHPSQFEGPRSQAPNFMPGPRGIPPQPFEEQRVNSPPRFASQRAPGPLPFGGPRGAGPFPEKTEHAPSRFHLQGQPPQGTKPMPRPLLQLPSHPPQLRKDRWDDAGPAVALAASVPAPGPEPEAPWPPADFREGKGHEYRSQAFEGRLRERFEAGPKEKALDESEGQLSDSRQGRAFEDRRREREHGKAWERDRGKSWGRERDWDRHREKDSGREWDRSKERGANRDKERESERGRDWDRNRERSRNRDRDRDRRRERDRSRSRDRDKARDKDREKGRERRERSRSRGRAREPEPDTPRGPDPGGPSPAAQ